jgi:LAO/AO transport system kinase
MWKELQEQLLKGDEKTLARTLSLVENEAAGYETFLESLPGSSAAKIIGITGPPGAGKSTLVDALIGSFAANGKKIGVLCVDPSSPFNMGALLGDRIRMSDWYNNPNVFIRSLATRGSLGGLHPKIIELTEVMKAAPFDHVIVETVGVGQSEVEIAGLADTTVVVVVPEAGDEVQTMKAGLMEIADIFVVNKSDRPDADTFARNLKMMIEHHDAWTTPIIKTIATQKQGIQELCEKITEHQQIASEKEKRSWLLAERAYQLIVSRRMKDVSKKQLKEEIFSLLEKGNFNLYQFSKNH